MNKVKVRSKGKWKMENGERGKDRLKVKEEKRKG